MISVDDIGLNDGVVHCLLLKCGYRLLASCFIEIEVCV